MKKYLFIAAAAIAALSGCQKEGSPVENGQPDSGSGLVFTASIEQGANTKTILETTAGPNYGKIYWEDYDEICINGTPYSATPDGGDATKATFDKVNVTDPDPTGTFYAYYPASIYNGGTPTLPPTQSYAAGKISNNPMYATSEDTNLSFKNICGLLAVKVTNADIATLKSIRVSSSNHDMSGAFSVNASNEAVLSSDAGGTNKVELVSTSPLTLTAEGTVFYIAIPPATYQNLKIELSADGSNYTTSMTTKASTDIVVARNTIYNINFVDQNYLCFTATGGSITIALNKKGFPTTNTVEYSKDKSTWTENVFDDSGNGSSIALTDGQKLYFRAKTNRIEAQDTYENYVYFSITGDGTAEVSGNVMYLLNTDPGLSLYNEADCACLFSGCGKLTNAAKLLLPATSLTKYCYQYMFTGCGFETAPALPATSLAESCYEFMFATCSSLKTAPALPATELAALCYHSMFYCCPLKTAPALPATELAVFCYAFMFEECSSLTTAPALPATSLAKGCYECMFASCSSLTTALALPATKLVDRCYRKMFSRCRKLSSITCLATDISADACTEEWVDDVSGSGTFTKAKGADWSGKTGVNGIPSGWTVVDYVP